MSKYLEVPLVKKVLEYAKDNKALKYSPQAVEEEEGRRKGYYAEDVTGFYYPESFRDYLTYNIDAFKKAKEEFGFFKAFQFLSIYWHWSSWIWVVDSKDTIKDDVVDKIIQATGKNQNERLLMRQKHSEYVAKVTDEEVTKELLENYDQISPAIWVSKKDPLVIVYDKKYKPYAYKDGWSKEQIGEILSEWLFVISQEKIEPKYVEDASW